MEYLFLLLSNIYCLTASTVLKHREKKSWLNLTISLFLWEHDELFSVSSEAHWNLPWKLCECFRFVLLYTWIVCAFYRKCSSSFPQQWSLPFSCSAWRNVPLSNNWRSKQQPPFHPLWWKILWVPFSGYYHEAEQVCGLTVLWNREFHNAWGQAALQDSS